MELNQKHFFFNFILKFFLDLSDFFPVDNLDTVKTLLKDPDVRTDFTDDVRMTFIISWIRISSDIESMRINFIYFTIYSLLIHVL